MCVRCHVWYIVCVSRLVYSVRCMWYVTCGLLCMWCLCCVCCSVCVVRGTLCAVCGTSHGVYCVCGACLCCACCSVGDVCVCGSVCGTLCLCAVPCVVSVQCPAWDSQRRGVPGSQRAARSHSSRRASQALVPLLTEPGASQRLGDAGGWFTNPANGSSKKAEAPHGDTGEPAGGQRVRPGRASRAGWLVQPRKGAVS